MSKNIAIILGEFHKKEVTEMLAEARKVAAENNLNITEEIWVNGSYEKPLALKRVLQKDSIDGVVLLGIIERGETKHGLVMGHTVLQSVINLELEYMKPVGIGILGPEILPEQIAPRLLPNAQKAVLAVASMMEK
jgi:6,7-dimethyl-8-ribityllumazine synthase